MVSIMLYRLHYRNLKVESLHHGGKVCGCVCVHVRMYFSVSPQAASLIYVAIWCVVDPLNVNAYLLFCFLLLLPQIS